MASGPVKVTVVFDLAAYYKAMDEAVARTKRERPDG